MKPRTVDILLALVVIVLLFISFSVFLALYLMFYEWTKEIGLSFWQFVFTMAGMATILSLPKIVKTKRMFLDSIS